MHKIMFACVLQIGSPENIILDTSILLIILYLMD